MTDETTRWAMVESEDEAIHDGARHMALHAAVAVTLAHPNEPRNIPRIHQTSDFYYD